MNEREVEHVRKNDVVEKTPGSANEARILFALHRPAHCVAERQQIFYGRGCHG
jgi:hypothetical protein